MTKAIDAAIYVRISRDSEAQGLGVKRQEKDCRALAKQLGWDVVEVYSDNDVSASKRKPRPQYQAMMRAVESRQVQAVVVWDVDRLTRKPRELEDWIDHADALGLRLASVGGEIDLATEQGRAMARMKGVFARLEAESIAKRQRAKHEELALAGRYVGPRPFGYAFATDEKGTVLSGAQQRLVIDAEEAAVIRECARRVLADEGLWSIANDLNKRGVTTSTGARWQSQPLRRMLLRWTHAGYRKHQQFKNDMWIGPTTLHEAAWDPIIDRDTHERVIAKLTDPKRITNHGDTELKYLLTWMVLCGECDQPMVGAKGYSYEVKGYKRKDGTRGPSRVRDYPAKYACPHAGCHATSRRMDVVDEYAEAHVVALLEKEGIEIFGGDQAALDDAREQIADIEAKQALLSDNWMDGRITQAQFDRQNGRLLQRLKVEQGRLTSARPSAALEGFAGTAGAEAWKAADVARKRAVLRVLIAAGLRITIDKIGPGAFSAADADRYQGIRVEWDSAPVPQSQ